MIPYIALILTIAGIIIGASVITISEFDDTLENDGCWNASYIKAADGVCVNASFINSTNNPGIQGEEGLNLSDEGYTAYKSLEGLGDVAQQQPTVAIITVMVIIISVIAGVFVYMRMFA